MKSFIKKRNDKKRLSILLSLPSKLEEKDLGDNMLNKIKGRKRLTKTTDEEFKKETASQIKNQLKIKELQNTIRDALKYLDDKQKLEFNKALFYGQNDKARKILFNAVLDNNKETIDQHKNQSKEQKKINFPKSLAKTFKENIFDARINELVAEKGKEIIKKRDSDYTSIVNDLKVKGEKGNLQSKADSLFFMQQKEIYPGLSKGRTFKNFDDSKRTKIVKTLTPAPTVLPPTTVSNLGKSPMGTPQFKNYVDATKKASQNNIQSNTENVVRKNSTINPTKPH